MKKYSFQRLLTLLLAVILCTAPASAANIIHEEAHEILPNYNQMDAETAVATYLTREMDLNLAAVCGILANMEYESGIAPSVWGDGGTSYGLCQWHESRCRSLFSFCRENGYDVDSVYGQVEYLRYELEKDYPTVLESLQNVEDSSAGAYRAAWCWCCYYEIPAQRDVQASLRGNLAAEKHILRNTGR